MIKIDLKNDVIADSSVNDQDNQIKIFTLQNKVKIYDNIDKDGAVFLSH